MVRTRTHTHTPIRDIKLGDAVWNGTEFTDVFMLARADEQAEAIFVTIDELRLTPGHLVVRCKIMASGQLQDELIPAGKIRVGDKIRDSNGAWKALASVTPPTFGDGGTFAPLTMSGKIAVDGIVSSTHPKAYVALVSSREDLPLVLHRATLAGESLLTVFVADSDDDLDAFASSGRVEIEEIELPD